MNVVLLFHLSLKLVCASEYFLIQCSLCIGSIWCHFASLIDTLGYEIEYIFYIFSCHSGNEVKKGILFE